MSLVIATTSLCQSPLYANEKLAVQIVALVDETPITSLDINKRAIILSKMLGTNEETAFQGELQIEALRHLIDEIIIEREANKLEISISDESIDAAVQNIIRHYIPEFNANDVRYARLASVDSMDLTSIAKQIRKQFLIEEMIKSQVVTQPIVTKQQVDEIAEICNATSSKNCSAVEEFKNMLSNHNMQLSISQYINKIRKNYLVKINAS